MALHLNLTKGPGLRLIPADPESAEALQAVPVGTVLHGELRQPRNLHHHRKAFALLQAVYEAQAVFPTFDSFLIWVKTALGYTSEMTLPKSGRVITVPKSMSFGAMDQAEFTQLYDRLVALILEQILPRVDREDLDRRIHEILDGRGSV